MTAPWAPPLEGDLLWSMLHTWSMKWWCLEALQQGTLVCRTETWTLLSPSWRWKRSLGKEHVCARVGLSEHTCAMETARTALLSGWKARLKAHREPHCPSTTKRSLSESSGTGQPLPTTVLVFSAHAFPSSSHFPPKPGLQKGAAKQTSKKHTLPPAMNQFFHLPSLLVSCCFLFCFFSPPITTGSWKNIYTRDFLYKHLCSCYLLEKY